jgi:uncharacterized protein YndB with AHSA1/START domain
MADYRFLTTWLLDAPIESAWEALEDNLSWPQWWKGVERVSELEPGDADRIGGRYLIAWRSRLPYELEFEFRIDRKERPHVMSGTATGELTGEGYWRLFEHGGVTAVLYEWNVRTTQRWMNLLAPLARPVFAWNHDVVMRQGGEGLARRLGARLLVAG